jgi:hypothetical protein
LASTRVKLMLFSFIMIGDTMVYDRCCHVSTTNDDLWLNHSGLGIYP